MKYSILVILIFSSGLWISGQQSVDELREELNSELPDTTRVDKLEQLCKSLLGSNPSEAIDFAQNGREVAIKIKDKEREARMTKTIGLGYYYKADYIETLDYWEEALSIYESISDTKGTSNLLSNLGSVYETTGDQTKALDYHLRALRLAETNRDSVRIATALQNIGVVYSNMNELEQSIDFYNQSLELCQQLAYTQCIGLSYLNISEVYENMDSLDVATEYASKAIKILEQNEDPLLPFAIITVGRYKFMQGKYDEALAIGKNAYEVGNERRLKATMQLSRNLIGNVRLKQGEYRSAINNFSEAIKIGESIGTNGDLVDAYEGFIEAHDALGNFKISGVAKDSLLKINKRIFNIDRDNSLNNLQLEYDLEKRNSEINLLNKEREIQELTLSKAIRNRNGLATVTVLMLLFSGVIYWMYKKVNDAKKRSDELLLNILPAQTAEELKQRGFTTARNHENVAIMFTDFVDFTKIAQNLNPQDLVKSIDCYFKKFDEITAKYELEKIKTIGDSYLAASGLDNTNNDFKSIINAALEMQQFVSSMLNNPSNEISKPFTMRIGIHLGPVVAGVVGVKKFQYDIWGNTVNVASRIESSSIPGKIAISETLYNEIQSVSNFFFEKRDKISVKNIGLIQTYFVSAD